MDKDREQSIRDEIQNILGRTLTATELAEWYLEKRPSASSEAISRNEIRETVAAFAMLSGKQDVIDEISEAYLHFTAYILYEDGFFSNKQIHDMLLSPEEAYNKMDESRRCFELFNSMPVAVTAKTAANVRTQLLCNSREPLYLTSQQVTDIQMLCLESPEATTDLMHMMRQRPCIRAEQTNDRPYLQALIKVVYTLITNSISTTQLTHEMPASEVEALIVGIMNAFYDEYLSFPSDDCLADLVKSSITTS